MRGIARVCYRERPVVVPRQIPASASEIVGRLERHRTLGGAPREELEWLSAHGELYHVAPGELVTPGDEVHPFVSAGLDSLIILFSGRLTIYVDHGAGPHKVMEWTAGDVSGYLPYSRMAGPPIGEMIVEDAIEGFLVHRIHFVEMICACPWVTTTLVHVMLDRARHFRASELHDEKMKSLGKLSAGLAHELNNPASASARSARLLSEALAQADAAARMAGARLSETDLAIIDRARETFFAAPVATLSAMERADREEALAEWLEAHAADANAATALVDAGVGIEALDHLAATVDATALATAVHWIATSCTAHTLAAAIERASARIWTLVGAVKRFTYMDRALAPEAVDVAGSVHDSVVLLQHKARTRSIVVDVQIASDLPAARAIGGDLNQVWMNLLDNALDAAPESGYVTISANRALNRIVVRIIDNGPGIPPEIGKRIFDPFVTSKPVGQGTGLGLDIARQLVRRNDGDIEVDSRPGRTEFRVVLRPFAADPAESPSGRGVSS